MSENYQPLLNTPYLHSVWAKDYETFKASLEADALLTRLKNWTEKVWQKETASEGGFIDAFFKQTWGYVASGAEDKKTGYTLQQQFPVRGAVSEYRWIAKEEVKVAGKKDIWDENVLVKTVLSNNIYGVDINAESVEITRLALWLHTALPDRPLTSLDKNIRCGNSLIGHDFYNQMGITKDLFGEDERERVNTFSWEETFPKVFQGDDPGFDFVIGNPPYVKLQHFSRV
ncbi:hypothetical protein K8T06_03160 [bacterium]|nr:hypothetical protein [bacterium]